MGVHFLMSISTWTSLAQGMNVKLSTKMYLLDNQEQYNQAGNL